MHGREFLSYFFIPNVIDWGMEDPKDKPIARVREIRDEIERRIKELATAVVAKEDNSK
jgi:arsenate reductase (thioredoxin)